MNKKKLKHLKRNDIIILISLVLLILFFLLLSLWLIKLAMTPLALYVGLGVPSFRLIASTLFGLMLIINILKICCNIK